MRGQQLKPASCLAALLLLAACGQTDLDEAYYEHDQCSRIALINEVGDTLVGVEDIAPDLVEGQLFLSAYDRRLVERAVRRKDDELPQGSVYKLSLDDIFESDGGDVSVVSLIAPGEIAGGVRPHGLDFDAVNHELIFVNRAYERNGRSWKMTPHLQRIGANGELFVGETSRAPCSANDVALSDDQVYTSFDHSACNWRAGVEDIFRLKRSGVAGADGAVLFDRAAFANGIVKASDKEIAIGATRENALLFFKISPDSLEQTMRIETPGGPDNLTRTDSGAIIAALHPAKFRLMLNRKFGIGKAPSRIVRIDRDKGEVEVLFEDRSGELFSAATVAVETSDGLVAGSVTDEGVLVCREAS